VSKDASELKETFVNEIGNKIHLSISSTDEDVEGGVNISLSGPTSISENIITRMEAEKMMEGLNEFLQSASSVKKEAQPMPFGSTDIRDGLIQPKGDFTDMQLETSGPSALLNPEESSLEEHDPSTTYEAGIVSPVAEAYNWADDKEEEKKEAQVTVWKSATIPLAAFQCGVASSYQDKVVGLQSYKSLDSTAGLLFPYSKPRDLMYHMGTVSFPIDIIFANEHGEIKRLYRDIQPGSLATFGCSDAKYVLEIYGGLSNRLGIDVGDVIELSPKSSYLKNASKVAKQAGFSKQAILTHSSSIIDGAMKWGEFPIVNLEYSMNKKASQGLVKLASDFMSTSTVKDSVVTAFYLDGLINSAPMVRVFSNYKEVDDGWSGKVRTDVYGRTVATGKGKLRDPRDESPYGKATYTIDSFASFMHIDTNDYYNQEVEKFLHDIKAAYDIGNKLVFCTSSKNSSHLVDMIQHKVSYYAREYIDLARAQVLTVSDEMDATNIIECISERYPEAKIEVRADNSILKRAGVPVPDDIKRKGQQALKALSRGLTLVEESLEKMLKNKSEYQKHESDEKAIEQSKGHYHQSVKRNTGIIKSYLIKIRDAIRILNEIKDITTTLQVIDGLVSTSKAAADTAEEVFNMKNKMDSMEFATEFSSHTENYERAAEDLISAIERAKEYVNSNILGIIVLSE
jgi:uncharacterized protein